MVEFAPYPDADREYGNIQNAIDYFLKFEIERDKTILDIGTNRGSFPYGLHMRGYRNVRGIDVRGDAIRHGQAQYPAIADGLSCYDGYPIPFASESVDVITMFDVIEHIPRIEEFLLEANRVLVRGGVFVFQTPNIYINSVWSTVVWRSLRWKEEHCSLQSLRSLGALLRRTGFSQIAIDKYSVNTEFNRSEVGKRLGSAGLLLLRLSDKLPLGLYPNFYGSAMK
jgi:SAM-dependent methyltransferase